MEKPLKTVLWRMPWSFIYSEGSPTVWSVHTHALQTSPNYLPGTFWWTTGGNNRASCHQATGCRQRAGQAVTSLSFIHLLIQSFLLPTGKALVGMCPQAQAQCLFLVLHVFQSSAGHKERPRWSHWPGHHFPVHSGNFCRHLKCLWPHRSENGQRPQPQCWTVEGCPASRSQSVLGWVWWFYIAVGRHNPCPTKL